jgi:hypothetical protein
MKKERKKMFIRNAPMLGVIKSIIVVATLDIVDRN